MTTEISTQRAATGLALATFDDAFRFAKMVSGSDFAPKDFKGKPESCLLAIQHGSEIGLSPMQSLQNIACINGRPAIWGDAALALCLASPVCDGIHETIDGDGDNMTAVCKTSRKGKDANVVARFSVADAKKAGLWGKAGPWTQYPKRMLQLRARGFALRDAFPDVLKGLVTAEEAQDYPTPEPAREPVMVRPAGEPARPATARIEAANETAEQKARMAIQRAKTLEDCDRLRDLIGKRHAEGVFTDATRDDLVDLLHGKAEILIGSDAEVASA